MTIVLNGMPFIKEHKAIFEQLKVPWRWHIVEGVALPLKCTGWCQHVLLTDHKNWLSNDGTTEYLDSITCDQIRVYRQATPKPWAGKLDMCNAPLASICAGSVLHELDVDEFWSAPQLEKIHALFTEQNGGRGWYYCDYYLGPDICMVDNKVYPAAQLGAIWVRTHRYAGQPWLAHEPPTMAFQGREVAHAETESLGLVFKHFAYCTPEQLRFKENYYRRPGALAAWNALQANSQWPAYPGLYLRWVGPNAVVNKTEHYADTIRRLQKA